jgi:hypothetical protein
MLVLNEPESYGRRRWGQQSTLTFCSWTLLDVRIYTDILLDVIDLLCLPPNIKSSNLVDEAYCLAMLFPLLLSPRAKDPEDCD